MYINNKSGCLAIGGSKDSGKYKEIGDKRTPLLEFSLAVGKDEQGSTKWVNCKAWNPIASRFKERIIKGEKYLVTGGWEKREHNGSDYYTLVVEFMTDMGHLVNLSVASSNIFTNAIIDDSEDDIPDFMK